MIRLVTEKDLNEWLDLAREVEPLFGEMAENEDFKNGIIDCISNSSAFCVVNNNNDIEGIIAINKACNEVSWLAVRERGRGKGYGRQLLEAALGSLDNRKHIIVQTFSPGIKVGEAARRLYMRFGFKDFKDGGKNPAGIDTVIMKLENSGVPVRWGEGNQTVLSK
jgi:GNAT superfamily N-acetyltransferase